MGVGLELGWVGLGGVWGRVGFGVGLTCYGRGGGSSSYRMCD